MGDQEFWKQIPGWPYEASSLGRIRHAVSLKPLKAEISKQGYQRVRLCANGVQKAVKVHRMVCLAFHGFPFGDAKVARHLDDNKNNNTPENLAWGTHADNHSDALRNGRVPLGMETWNSRLTDEDVLAIRRSNESSRVLGKRLNLDHSYIRSIRRGERWTHVTEEGAG